MSSGGGQSGETRYNWNPFMENMWAGGQGGNTGLLNRAVNTLNQPYQQYGGQRVAGLDRNTTDAEGLIRQAALGNDGKGDPATAAGKNTAMELAQGKGLNANPYGGMSNPYFGGVLKSGLEDITNAYKQGTSADTTRLMNLSGAFGGSAHQNAIANNENALAKQLSQYTQGMQNQQYDRSANLYEGAAGRQLGAIPLAMQGQNLSFDAARQLAGIGDINRSYQQSLLDQQYNDWTQGQNWERGNLGWMANLLGMAQGSTGVQTTTGGYGGISPAAGILGAGALYGAYK